MGEVIERNRDNGFGSGGGGDAGGIDHNEVAVPQTPVPHVISNEQVVDINEMLSDLHPLVIFGVCLLYECLSFLVLISNGRVIYKLMSSSDSKLSLIIASPYYGVSLVSLILKLIQDQLETIYIGPVIRPYLQQTNFFQKLSVGATIAVVCACYSVVLTEFYRKFNLLNSKESPNPIPFVIALSYIQYFNVRQWIIYSKPTTYLHDAIQHTLNFQFARMLLNYGELCGRLLFIQKVNVNYTSFLLTFPPVIMTIAYFALQNTVFRNVPMGSGTKWAEITWGLVSADYIFRSYMHLSAQADDTLNKGIQFYMGIAFLLYLSTKSVAMNFVKVKF